MFLVSVSLFLLSRLLPTASDETEFRLVYGHVLAQKLSLPPSTPPPSDVSEALQVAQKVVQLETGAYAEVQDFNKSRLYYTANGVTPYILEQKVIISMQVYVQRMHILLGFLYTISLQRAEHQSLVHRLTVTRHLNNEYHVFSHTMTTHPQPYPSSEFSNWDVGMPGGINHVYHRSGHQCWGICCHGDNQCPVCTGQEDTSPAFHWEKHSERRVHGNHCLQTAEWLTLTNGCCCRYCNGTQHSRESLLSHRSLRIATYNMWNINSLERESYAERLHRLGQMLRAQDLDILAVQEVRFDSAHHTHNQVEELTRYLPGYQYVFQPAMLYMERIDVRTEEGVAILSRHPIVNHDYILLFRNESDVEDTHQRICLHAEILTPYSLETIHVFVTHLSLSSAPQEKSVVELWRYMSSFRGYKLLMGDFNAEPDSTVIRFLRGEVGLDSVFTDGLLRDTWLEAGHKSDKLDGLTFSTLTDTPTKRIDYIFHQPHSSHVGVTSASVMDEGDHCFPPCSDHFGVVATIGWSPPT